MQNTTEIKVLGTGTSKHQMVSSVLKDYVKKAGLEIAINDYTDIDSFVKDGIESVPAVVFEDKVFTVGNNGSFNKSLRNIVTSVLKKSNFGNIEKIVIPVDFSDVSTNAFAYGHRLATDLNAITKAVHVFLPSAKDVVESAAVNLDFAKLRESYLEDFVAKFDSDWGSDVMKVSLIDREFRTGFPGDQIIESIEENKAMVTVIGTTGQSSFLRKWFGSVSTKVMNDSESPVLVIPEEANYHGINKIAYAYQDIAQDRAIVAQLTNFASHFDAEIHLIHVEDSDSFSDPGYYLKELFEKEYPSENIKNASIKSEDIAQGLSKYSIDHKIDVICLSTHKKKFFEQLYDDNITLQMAAKSLPILVLKAQQ